MIAKGDWRGAARSIGEHFFVRACRITPANGNYSLHVGESGEFFLTRAVLRRTQASRLR